MLKKKVTIIGSGPNSVNALDVILKLILTKKIKNNISQIAIYDERGLFGCGNTHNINLHKSIILNRIAGQIALGAAPFIKFPHNLKKYDYNFMDWLKFKYKKTKKNKYKILPTDWPSRNVYGEALIDKLFDLISLYNKKTNIRIKLVSEKILEVKKISTKYYLKTSSNNFIETNKILICTGVTKRTETKNNLDMKLKKLLKNTNSTYISDFLSALPNENFFKKYKKKLNICLLGAGVSSLDIINFCFNNKKKINTHIYPISRTGLFPFARPVYQTQKNTKKYEHKPILFRKTLVKKIKKKFMSQGKNLIYSFQDTIFPVLKVEFYLIYFKEFLSYKNYYFLLRTINKKLYQKLSSNKISNNSDLEILANKILLDFVTKKQFTDSFYKKNWFAKNMILKNIINNKITFFDIFTNPLIFYRNHIKYKDHYLKFLSWDINEARKGNISSPFKKACDGLWRDIRPTLTYLIDDNTLDRKSYEFFLNKILPIHNRLADGPSLESIIRIKNLIKNKKIIIDPNLILNKYNLKKKNNNIYLNFSNKNISLDLLFFSILQVYKPIFDNRTVIGSLLKNKIACINKKYSFGVNLSKNLHPLSKKNKEDKNITLVGASSEGVKFFHHTLPRPDKKQAIIFDLENWAKKI